jgi:hypothetical protein
MEAEATPEAHLPESSAVEAEKQAFIDSVYECSDSEYSK